MRFIYKIRKVYFNLKLHKGFEFRSQICLNMFQFFVNICTSRGILFRVDIYSYARGDDSVVIS